MFRSYRASALLGALLLSLSANTVAQIGERPLPAPQDVLDAFRIRAGTVQELQLPANGAQTFRCSIELGGKPYALELALHDIRSPNFQLLVDVGGGRLNQVATPRAITYQGTIAGLAESVVAASLENGRLSAFLRFPDRTTYGIEPVAKLFPGVPAAHHLVFEAKDVRTDGIRCGNDDLAAPLRIGQNGGGGGGPAAPMKVCEIAIDADEDYYARNGSNVTQTQNAVTTVMNAVDVIYRRDVEITYRITTIIVRTSATYTGTDMGSLLTQFGNRWNSQHGGVVRDVAHLFTGKGNFSGVIGIAYLGVICNIGSAYGVSKAYSNLTANAGLVSHEVGHNWNAPHCDAAPPCYIMCSGLGGCSGSVTLFDQGTKNVILAFKASRSCLSDPPATQAPTLTAANPSTVTAYQGAQMAVTGTGLDTVTSVTLGGTPVFTYSRTSATTMNVLAPSPFDINTHNLVVANNVGPSNPLPINVIGNHPSVLETPVLMPRGIPVPHRAHTDRAWSALWLLSFSNQPSVLPGFLTLGIGNGFSDLFNVVTIGANNAGNAEFTVIVPPLAPPNLTYYWQAITFDPSNLTFPLEVSDVRGCVTL